MNKSKEENLVPHQIKKNKNFVKGPVEEKFGVKADFSQATFIMNDTEFDKDLDKLLSGECTPNDIIYLFYGHLFPYIKATLDDNFKLFKRAEASADDGQKTVNMFGKLKFDHDIMMDFIKDKGLVKEFTGILREKQNELDKKVKKVIAESQEKQLKLL